ncbi:hypothetical protein KSP39_PZI013106 [Platanthera zijinensis]|uniref:Uncharacterized protein n=1 Tax=Platanthera zijinensis TaxID=2320716 RepID=A0AAP0B8U2_9ASPA
MVYNIFFFMKVTQTLKVSREDVVELMAFHHGAQESGFILILISMGCLLVSVSNL